MLEGGRTEQTPPFIISLSQANEWVFCPAFAPPYVSFCTQMQEKRWLSCPSRPPQYALFLILLLSVCVLCCLCVPPWTPTTNLFEHRRCVGGSREVEEGRAI